MFYSVISSINHSVYNINISMSAVHHYHLFSLREYYFIMRYRIYCYTAYLCIFSKWCPSSFNIFVYHSLSSIIINISKLILRVMNCHCNYQGSPHFLTCKWGSLANIHVIYCLLLVVVWYCCVLPLVLFL